MKFFIVLACLALANAQYQRQSSYSGYSSGGGSGGLSYGGGSGGLSYGGGSGGLAYGGGLGGLVGGNVLQAQQQVPVTLLVAQPVRATAAYANQGASYGAASGGRAHSGGVIEAAVISTRNVQVVDAPSTPVDSSPAQVVIPPTVQGVHLEFQSQSSPITVTANHIPGQAAAPQESSHEEEADIIRQYIVKPVIHEVHEVIVPQRRVSQEVKPVEEQINQVVTTGHREVHQQAVQRSAGYSAGAQRGGQATILALVADGSAAGLLSGGGASGASYGGSYGASRGVAGGYRTGGVQGLGGGYGGSVQRTSGYSARSASY